jgi:hypothetical protein
MQYRADVKIVYTISDGEDEAEVVMEHPLVLPVDGSDEAFTDHAMQIMHLLDEAGLLIGSTPKNRGD